MAWWTLVFPIGWRRRVFPIYCKPFPAETRARVLEKSAKEGFSEPGRALFLHCHAIVKKDKTTYERMTTFLNLYGFCRNVCMGALVAVPVLVYGAFRDTWIEHWRLQGEVHREMLWWAVTAAAVALGMVYRYLKFYRHYTTEVFMTYAEFKDQGKPSGGADDACK